MLALTRFTAARFAVVLLLGTLGFKPAMAQTIINFDDVSDKTDVRMQYQARGVTFSCDGTACTSPSIANGIYARATTPTASTPNSVTPVRDGFPGVKDSATGRVIANFSSAVKTVSVDARSILVPEPLNQTAYANMTAFDANGAVVGSATGTQLNTFETLTVSTSGNQISRVSLGVSGTVAIATFDNLRFEGDPGLTWVWFPFFIIVVLVIYWFFRKKKDLPRPPAG